MQAGVPDLARIGPNAILQLVPVLDQALGERARRGLFVEADVALPPPDAGMLPQAQVVRLHQAVCYWFPSLAPDLLKRAGLATGDYILANRIPPLAQQVIRALPKALGARVLAKAIATHAWTFTGSGVFAVQGYRPLTLSISQNPLATGLGKHPDCHWHVAVFQRLFQSLVWPGAIVTETTCRARGDACCQFRITPKLGA